MADSQLRTLIRHLRRTSNPSECGRLDDAELLARFVAERDEAAFEVLTWRHGPMVLSMCRRFLRHEHDAEDAFQATFLTLVRKASSINKSTSLAGWLYKVAYRICLAARSRSIAQPLEETRLDLLPSPAGHDEVVMRDLGRVLDEELHRLPHRYRDSFVLCYLEGMTNSEAAEHLGCPPGTVMSRLSWAREKLRTRLTRRGVTLTSGLLTALLAESANATAVSANLIDATIQTVNAHLTGRIAVSSTIAVLAEGAVRKMFLTKFIVAVAGTFSVGLLAWGTGYALNSTRIEDQVPSAASGSSNTAEAKEPIKPAKAEPLKVKTHPVTITGRATNEIGRPIKGATVYLMTHVGNEPPVVAKSSTDDDGNYVIRDAPLPYWPDSALTDFVKPAVRRAGITKRVGWL